MQLAVQTVVSIASTGASDHQQEEVLRPRNCWEPSRECWKGVNVKPVISSHSVHNLSHFSRL